MFRIILVALLAVSFGSQADAHNRFFRGRSFHSHHHGFRGNFHARPFLAYRTYSSFAVQPVPVPVPVPAYVPQYTPKEPAPPAANAQDGYGEAQQPPVAVPQNGALQPAESQEIVNLLREILRSVKEQPPLPDKQPARPPIDHPPKK